MTAKARSTQGTKHGYRTKKKRKTQVIAGLTHAALTNALSPTGGVKVKRGLHVDSDTLVVTTKGDFKGKGKKVFLSPYVIRGVKPVGSVLVSDSLALRRKPNNVSSTLVDENKPIAERLQLLGARPGSRLEGEQVAKVLSSIRAGAEQIIGSGATASELLSNTNFDGTGMTAEQLVREGRAGRVLSRLDDLRYGARG